MDHAEILHIRLNREGNWPPFAFEEVEAIPVGDHQFKIVSPPTFARRLAVGDLVRVAHYGSPEQPWVEDVVEWSGNSTVRVIIFRSAGDRAESDLRDEIRRLGGQVYSTRLQGMIAIDVPASTDYRPIRDFLAKGEERKAWEYEEGAISARHDLEAGSPGEDASAR